MQKSKSKTCISDKKTEHKSMKNHLSTNAMYKLIKRWQLNYRVIINPKHMNVVILKLFHNYINWEEGGC